MDILKKAQDLSVREKTAWRHRANNREFQIMARVVGEHAPEAQGAPVVVFNASTRLTGVSLNAGYSILTAWALGLQGVPVIHFVCQSGLSRCVLGTRHDRPEKKPPCTACIAQSQALYSGRQVRWLQPEPNQDLANKLVSLHLDDLTRVEVEGLPLGRLVLPSLRWILRRHHLADDERTCFLYREYILSAAAVARQFSALLDETQPRAVLLFNGMFYPEAVARQLARIRGIPAISHEVGLQPFSAFFTTGEATAYPIDIPEQFELSLVQNQQLDAYLEQRFRGNFSMAGIRFWPDIQPLSSEFWLRAGKFKQIVPVFTNVIFDTSQGHANVIFPHMFAWLDQVLEIIQNHPETYFVLRAHPDESRPGKESRESVADWARSRGIGNLPNVLFVDSREYFSSYELIQRSKFVMVYNSTIGLEASILGVPVLCGGKARFTQIPTVFFPETPENYRSTAEDFLLRETIENPPEFQRNARIFLYYQIFKTSLSFEQYLVEDKIWPGFVKLSPGLTWEQLLPEHSPEMKIVLEGILHGKPFLA